LERTLNDNYEINDSIDRLIQFTRLVSDTFNINEDLIRQVIYNRAVSDTYNITDEVEYQKITEGLSVQLSDSYDVSDSVTREQILQRILIDTYDITDSVFKTGGEPIIIDEDDYKVSGGGGGGHISEPMFTRLKRKIMITSLDNILPEGFPQKIYIDNQKAFFLNNKIPQNRITAPLAVRTQKSNRLIARVYTWQDKQRDMDIERSFYELKRNKIDTKKYIENLPKRIYITNYDIENKKIINPVQNTISNKVVVKSQSRNILSSPIKIEPKATHNRITNGIIISGTSKNILRNSVYINYYKEKNTISNNVIVKPIATNIIKGEVREYKRDTIKKIKNFMLNRTKHTDYQNLLRELIYSKKDKDKKEQLMYYVSTYQTRFDIERTNTNKDMVKLENDYKRRFVTLYKQIFNEYKDLPHRMSEMREKYHKQVYDLVRTVADKGYDLGIDYVSRATGRPDIYLTETDIQNVKVQSEKSTNHFFESIEKNIAKEVSKHSAEALTPDYVPDPQITEEQAILLLLNGITVGLVGLATISKLTQISDLFSNQNVPIKFVFITEQDLRVCPYCSTLDYRISNYEFTLNNVNMMPKPPIHFLCRCRILIKIGSKIIVK
jgi:hypothetical protein